MIVFGASKKSKIISKNGETVIKYRQKNTFETSALQNSINFLPDELKFR